MCMLCKFTAAPCLLRVELTHNPSRQNKGSSSVPSLLSELQSVISQEIFPLFLYKMLSEGLDIQTDSRQTLHDSGISTKSTATNPSGASPVQHCCPRDPHKMIMTIHLSVYYTTSTAGLTKESQMCSKQIRLLHVYPPPTNNSLGQKSSIAFPFSLPCLPSNSCYR